MAQSSKTKIAHVCTFCGGPVELESNEIIAPCGNCGSMLRLLPQSGMESFLVQGDLPRREAVFFLERELKKQKMPLINRRGQIVKVYLPFYRATGKVYNYRKRYIEHVTASEDGQEYRYNTEEQNSALRDREMSFAAFDSGVCGIESLGVRTSVMRLLPLTPKRIADRRFVDVRYDLNYALGRYEKSIGSYERFASQQSSSSYSKALCPQISVVYLPVWIINFSIDSGNHYGIVDCIAKRVVKIEEGEFDFGELNFDSSREGSIFKMVAHRCDYCGFDLPRQKNGEMFICSNCGRLYQSKGERYQSVQINLPRGDHRHNLLFPFWMFRLSNADHAEIIKKALAFDSDTIFIPAFEISNLKRAARLSLSLSRAVDEIDFDRLDESDYNFTAACVDSEHAWKMVLPYLLAGKDNLEHLDLEALWRLYLEYDEKKLIWLPFVEEGYFYRGLTAGLGFEKTALVT
jgi:predicted RNA-binding Zn-ribbon protein involved in translation (DUF1610 family)